MKRLDAMNKILLVGNGAREHVIAESLVKNDNTELYSFMSRLNPGIKRLSADYKIGDIESNNKIIEFAKKVKPDFAIIGPENPLRDGIVDALKEIEVKSASPNKQMSKIEWSKAYSRILMKTNDIRAYPEFYVISKHRLSDETTISEVKTILKDLNNEVAIKPDYLTGGKGVKIWGDHLKSTQEIIDYIDYVLSRGNNTVVIEKKLKRPYFLQNSEFTLQAFVSGNSMVAMPLVQDFKRAYDDDKGPNTGSMGSYSCNDHSLPFLSKKDYYFANKVMKKTIESLGNYVGVLYGQFMLTKEGVRLIEFNSRFGDPEALNVLPLLNDDFSQCCKEMIDGKLNAKTWDNKATVCVYLTPNGYPINPEENIEIRVDENKIRDIGCNIYYASVGEASKISVLTTKSRSLGILGVGDTITDAREQAYNAVSHISGNLHYRNDIAKGVEN
jgi:phosphoribosylamine--glycine ligase